jgi:uncharacterized protein involved in high-affinity Fe2+ transport
MKTTKTLACALLVAALGGLSVATAKESSLDTVTKADVGFTLVPSQQAPLAIDATDTGGRVVFTPAEGAALFFAVDIRALRRNGNGFGYLDFVPYLSISYTVRRADGAEAGHGGLYPLVTREGLRYGNNIKLPGAGTYVVSVTVEPPIKVGFGRHTDLETGVARWWAPFQVEWTLSHSAQKAAR